MTELHETGINLEGRKISVREDQPRSAKFQGRAVRNGFAQRLRVGGIHHSWKHCFTKAHRVWLCQERSLACAQQQSEAVIAAERLHQRALEGNGGIKLGTAGTYRRAGCFFFLFFFLLGHCSICAPPAPLRAPRQTHGQQALPSLLIGSCHGDAGSWCREWGCVL